MEMKKLCANLPDAPDVSIVGLGCNNFGMRIDEDQTRAVVHKALDVGINFFDTAEMYGGGGVSEEYLGRALGPRRKDIILGTKFGYGVDGSKENVVKSVEGSLKRLGTDVIDLYTLHKPDPETPIEETLEAMDALVKAGKVRYIGCSNFSGEQLDEAIAVSSANDLAPFVAVQNRLSLLRREAEDDIVPASGRLGVGFVPFFPLESGMLTGKYARGAVPDDAHRMTHMARMAEQALTDANYDIVERLQAFATAKGRTILELAMSWLAMKPEVISIIAGATKPEQVEANATAAAWKMSADEIGEIDRLTART